MSNTKIMGILNVTPDSFSDGGEFEDLERAVVRGMQMAEEGADIIDIGGESSRPGSEPVTAEEEMQRVLPVIEQLAQKISIPISIDTYKPEVAKAALGAGAKMVNDISGLRDEVMIKVVAEYQVPVVIMHMQGEPKTMQENPMYGDVIGDLKEFFRERIAIARAANIQDIIIDPGIGFGKTLQHNLEILRRLGELQDLECPILVGPSRKSFIGKIDGADIHDRLPGTLAAISIAAVNGASMVRVHDVKESRQAMNIVNAVVQS